MEVIDLDYLNDEVIENDFATKIISEGFYDALIESVSRDPISMTKPELGDALVLKWRINFENVTHKYVFDKLNLWPTTEINNSDKVRQVANNHLKRLLQIFELEKFTTADALTKKLGRIRVVHNKYKDRIYAEVKGYYKPIHTSNILKENTIGNDDSIKNDSTKYELSKEEIFEEIPF